MAIAKGVKIGVKNINIVLLDTVLPDDHMVNAMSNNKGTIDHKMIKEYATKEGYDQEHLEKVLKVLPIEENLLSTQLSGKLEHTNILLFKALDKNKKNSLERYILELPFQNVNKHCLKKNLIKKEMNCHHYNILNHHETITSNIIQWLNK